MYTRISIHMANHQIQFSLNDQMYDRLFAEQKRRGKTTVSVDMFAKELVCDLLSSEGKKTEL